jgi:hypothetical protein
MQRLIAISAVLGFTLALAAPALAGQCPKLVAQINAETGNRFDNAAAAARGKAAQADKLHKEGKHADSEKIAKEALASLGKKM